VGQEHRIKTDVRRVSFYLSNESLIDGEAFLSKESVGNSRSQNIGDLLRETDSFFPVKTPEGVILLNPAQIVYAKLSRREEEDELMRLGTAIQHVSVDTVLSKPLEGEICINLPEGLDRVQDDINEAGKPFVRLFQTDIIIYINRKFILSIRDFL
jgi:hypothetical protein